MMGRFLEAELGEGDAFNGNNAYETPTWGTMRVAGIIMMLMTITSHIALFLLAKKRRQREMPKAAINKALDEKASFIEFVPSDTPVATLEEIMKGQFDGVEVIDNDKEVQESNLNIFCGDPNQGVFSQLSKIQHTWLDTSKPGLAGLSHTLATHSKSPSHEQIGVGSPASHMAAQLLDILEQDQDAFLPQQSPTHGVNSDNGICCSKPTKCGGRKGRNISPATCWTHFASLQQENENHHPSDEPSNDEDDGFFVAFETDFVDVEEAGQSQEVVYDKLKDEAPLFLRRQTRIVE